MVRSLATSCGCGRLPPPFRSAIKPFQRPEGHTCKVSSGVHDCLTFGTGTLDDGGFWSVPCYECRAHEEQFPDCGPCWPHTDEQIQARVV